MMNNNILPSYLLTAIVDSASLSKLATIWVEVGYSEDIIFQRKQTVIKHVLDLLEEMVTEEEGIKNDLISKIEGYLKEADTISKELKMNISLECDEKLPLMSMELKLKDQLKEYQEIKERRMERLNLLLKEEEYLMKALGISRRTEHAAVPSEEELASFQSYLQAKTEDKKRLEDVFSSTRESIIAIMEDMAVKPTYPFEELVFDGISTFQLSQENMSKLKDLHQSMEKRQADVKALAYQLREKISQLWERLNEPAELRENFVSGYVGHSTETIQALKAEITRCEVKKRENIKHFVQAVREELTTWWGRCRYSEEQRLKFKHFTSDYFNEDLLELHEQEVNTIKSFYEENEQIFNLVSNRQNVWNKMVELHELHSQPNRLFGNRGGQLLVEEKERKKISVQLPRMEKVLQKLIEEYEQAKGEPFLIEGKNYLKFVSDQWNSFNEGIEFEKQARKAARKDPVDVTRSGYKSMAAGVTMKRKIATPRAANDLKRSRVNTPASVRGANEPTVRGSKKERNSRSKQVQRKIFNVTKMANAVPHHDPIHKIPDVISDTHNASTDTTYSDFQNYLEKKPTRSSGKQLVETCTKREATPSRTPFKPTMSLLRNTPRQPNTETRNRLGAASPRTPAANTPRYTPGRLRAAPLARVPFRF